MSTDNLNVSVSLFQGLVCVTTDVALMNDSAVHNAALALGAALKRAAGPAFYLHTDVMAALRTAQAESEAAGEAAGEAAAAGQEAVKAAMVEVTANTREARDNINDLTQALRDPALPVFIDAGPDMAQTTPAPKTPLQVAQALVEQADRMLGRYDSMECPDTRQACLELLCEARQWFTLKPAMTDAEIAKLIERG